MVRKFVVAAIVAAAAWFVSGWLEFPRVFQVMFVLYAVLGLLIFLLLDAPSLRPLAGWGAGLALLGFYALVSAVYILGAGALPQYDPEDEKGKIEKLLKAKKDRAAQESHQVEALLQQAGALESRIEALTARLSRVAPDASTAPEALPSRPPPSGTNLIARGMEVYDLYECYNCHKIGGKGSVKKRGPVLDNVGSFLTIEDMKKKIFDPTYLYAEGFEKEHKKGLMPDKYRELMTEEELSAVAAYLSTLKNPAVETPKPVFVKTKVEHGFIVYGYVRTPAGTPVPNVEVVAKPLKPDAHAARGKTNQEGYYELFLHLHNEDNGTKIAVSAGTAQKEVVANYDPNDKVTKRQAAVDLTTGT
jgi:mono/diheme cytochrome c family protein